MLKKTITYEDFDGNKLEEDFYFNLTKTELIEIEMSEEGGLENAINKIIRTRDNKKIMEMFKKIISMSYGEKSLDGKRFIKTDEIRENFLTSLAYDELFMELLSNEDAAAKFIKGIMPKDIDINTEDAIKSAKEKLGLVEDK